MTRVTGGMEGRMERSSSIAPSNEPDKIKILVVDDQPAKLLSYEVVLAGIGATLVKATSACEAFECLLKNDVALILVDVCMPQIGGFELATLIREHPRFERIAIIFVSAVMKADLHQLRGYELGAVDYIPVPVEPELLRAKVKVFIDLYRKTRQLERLNAELERQVDKQTAELRRCNEELEERIEERTREREAVLAQLFEAQQMDTVGQLAAVAHDFNNLLMAVQGSLTLLDKRLPEDPASHRLLQNATQGTRRGTALSQGLLAFSRRRELKPGSVDITGVVSGMEELLKHAVGFGIELTCRFPRTLPLVYVDTNQLELALLNLALNAREAMPGGGKLLISARRVMKDEVAAASSLPPGEYVGIKTVASGASMNEATRSKATEAVLAANGSVRETRAGLSMVQGMATRSGGLLCLGATNAGTDVELWLPRARTRPLGRNLGHLSTSPSLNAP
jgi:signal transduction histidine kinase